MRVLFCVTHLCVLKFVSSMFYRFSKWLLQRYLGLRFLDFCVVFSALGLQLNKVFFNVLKGKKWKKLDLNLRLMTIGF